MQFERKKIEFGRQLEQISIDAGNHVNLLIASSAKNRALLWGYFLFFNAMKVQTLYLKYVT